MTKLTDRNTYLQDLKRYRKTWLNMSIDQRKAYMNDVNVDIEDRYRASSSWATLARDDQFYHFNMPDCKVWLMLGAYGCGKSWTGSHWIIDMFKQGYKKLAILADTLGNAKKTMIEGESGIVEALRKEGYNTRVVLSGPHKRVEITGTELFIDVYSAEAGIAALKGNAYDAIWCDEQCCYRNGIDLWNEMMMRTRSKASGLPTKIFSSTTPEVTDLLLEQIPFMINTAIEGNELKIQDEIINEHGYIWVTTAATADNKDNLDPSTMSVWERIYKDTSFEEVFLKGKVILEIAGALWTRDLIEKYTVEDEPNEEDFIETNVYIDPAVTSKNHSDATGIIVLGLHQNGLVYVLREYELKERPAACMDVACGLYGLYVCDYIKAETNNGGDFIEEVLDSVNPNVAYEGIPSTKSKRNRARPVSAMTEKGKIRFIRGRTPILEKQLTTVKFSGDASETEDVGDAFVMGCRDLLFRQEMEVI